MYAIEKSRVALPSLCLPPVRNHELQTTESEACRIAFDPADTGHTSVLTYMDNRFVRWYDPVTGRWTASDPIGISGRLNQYVFCGDDPVNFTDPLGLWELSVGGGYVYAGMLTVVRNTVTGRWNVEVTGGVGFGAKVSWSPSVYDSPSGRNLIGVSAKVGVRGVAETGVATVAGVGVQLNSTVEFDDYWNYCLDPYVGGSFNLGPIQGRLRGGVRAEANARSGCGKDTPYCDKDLSIDINIPTRNNPSGIFAMGGVVIGVGW